MRFDCARSSGSAWACFPEHNCSPVLSTPRALILSDSCIDSDEFTLGSGVVFNRVQSGRVLLGFLETLSLKRPYRGFVVLHLSGDVRRTQPMPSGNAETCDSCIQSNGFTLRVCSRYSRACRSRISSYGFAVPVCAVDTAEHSGVASKPTLACSTSASAAALASAHGIRRGCLLHRGHLLQTSSSVAAGIPHDLTFSIGRGE